MDRRRTAINVTVLLALAAAVKFLPEGGRAASTAFAVLLLAWAAGLAWVAGRMYLEHRLTIYGLGDRYRALLYGAVAVGVVDVAAYGRLWQSPLGEFVWFVILGGVVGALVAVYRYSRTY